MVLYLPTNAEGKFTKDKSYIYGDWQFQMKFSTIYFINEYILVVWLWCSQENTKYQINK